MASVHGFSLAVVCLFSLLAGQLVAEEIAKTSVLNQYDKSIAELQERYDAARDEIKKRVATVDQTFTEEAKRRWGATLEALRKLQNAKLEANDKEAVVALEKAIEEFEKTTIPNPKKGDLEKLTRTSASRLRRRIKTLEDELNDAYRMNRQLLLNPSFDEDASVGEVPSWKKVEGDWNPTLPPHVKSRKPADGKAFLYAGICGKGVLQQQVDLSQASTPIDNGSVSFFATCEVASLDQKNDDSSEFKIDFLNADGEVVKSFSSGELTSTKGWTTTLHADAVPRESRTALVTLISRRHGKGEKCNDGYFDNVKFRITRQFD